MNTSKNILPTTIFLWAVAAISPTVTSTQTEFRDHFESEDSILILEELAAFKWLIREKSAWVLDYNGWIPQVLIVDNSTQVSEILDGAAPNSDEWSSLQNSHL